MDTNSGNDETNQVSPGRSAIPLILQRGITKDEFMPDGEAPTTAKTGTWSDCDQD